MAFRGGSTRRAWMRSWQICTAESIEGRIERSLPREPIFRKPMDGNVPWRFWRRRFSDKRPNDEPVCGSSGGTPEVPDWGADSICRCSGVFDARRILRADRLFGATENGGDWCPHGAGSYGG